MTARERVKLGFQIEQWQEQLVNLTRRNKLLSFKHTKSSSLELVSPPMSSMFSRLQRGPVHFFLPTEVDEEGPPSMGGDNPGSDEIVVDGKKAREILAALRNLERVTSQSQLDTGLWILYLGFGMLRWIDPSDDKPYDSPLLLQPVTFRRSSVVADFLLHTTEDDLVLNPALSIKLLSDFGIELPTAEGNDLSPQSVVEAVRKAIAGRKGWRVDDRVVLTTFTFHKEAMYRDLLDNAEIVEASPLIQAMAIGPDVGAEAFTFDPIPEDLLDQVAPSEDLASIRDADSTQRACIVAARDGRSFVMDGPPGTGKSQTISNIIAELLHDGRTVLFVSEKAAALDVVYKRLGEVGLTDFVLPLHSYKATRKEVAVEFGRALSRRPKAMNGFSDKHRADLVRARRELNDYAIAINERRDPLGRSLHEVLGRVTQLQHLPHAPVATIGKDLTPEHLAGLEAASQRLGRAWGPIARGDRFLWRSMRDANFSAARRQHLERSLQDGVSAVDRLVVLLEDLDASLGLGWTRDLQDATRLATLLAIAESNPTRSVVPRMWLVGTPPIDALSVVALERSKSARLLAEHTNRAVQLAGEDWREAPEAFAAEINSLIDVVNTETPRPTIPEHADRDWIASSMRILSQIREVAAAISDHAQQIEVGFQLAPNSLSFQRCSQLAELGGFLDNATPPEPSWLNPVVQAALTEAEAVLGTLAVDYRQRRASLHATFSDKALELDLDSIRTQLATCTGVHKLGGGYRSAKKALAACVVGGKVTPACRQRLDELIAWRDLRDKLTVAERQHGSLLGSYYAGPIDTDFDRLGRATGLARRALQITSGQSGEEVARQLAKGGVGDGQLLAASHELSRLLVDWDSRLTPQLARLGLDPASIDFAELPAWVDRVAPTLIRIDGIVNAVAQAIRMPLTVRNTAAILDAAGQAKRIESELAVTHDADVDLLGPSFLGPRTDFEQLERDLQWARSLVSAPGSPMHHAAVEQLLTMAPTHRELEHRITAVANCWRDIAQTFDDAWRASLDQDFAVSLADARALFGELESTIGDIDEWNRYSQARSDLQTAGLDNALSFIEAERLPAEEVPLVLERSILERWCDSILESDPRLKVLAPSERDNLVDRFRELDRSQVRNAAARVINACSDRRPTVTVGAASTIMREAEKKTRHKPIRSLLAETKEVALALKPCFMMSPLTVSQFLPPDLRFDVVIFDEASQVRPADAANCVYRGHQLIVAGDPRQLPPTSFFEQSAGDGTDEYDEDVPDDFDSVLDLCRSSGLPVLSLRWHYRSQHESLITYSNYEFYGGGLYTFPGALEHADDVGVEFYYADGTYRRGGARDNPIEAAMVVERVLHHRRNHPGLTLGVVAFSSAQEAAIVNQLERQASHTPEIPELLSDDRLDGFFVKNLENVQGDERDVIIFSIGYGRDENGKFTEQLGPLGKSGGERRLNVAITRARRRVEVVASVRAGDFPGTSAALGIRHLQRYLDFAERGQVALSRDLETSPADAESPFEEEVLRTIRSFGFDAVPQVGVAGFRIDIGVRHPARPGVFALGIECDGAAYHSSRVARDRDRLRQEILEGLDWTIYRIWGPSWYQNRATQEAALRAAIEQAVAAPHSKRSPGVVRADARPDVEYEDADLDGRPDWAIEYEPARYVPSGSERPFTDPANRNAIASAIQFITDREGPIHEDLLRRRINESFGIGRTGSLVKAAVDSALTQAIQTKRVKRIDDAFFVVPKFDLAVRIPADDLEAARAVGHVHPGERRLALRHLVRDARRLDEDSLLVAFRALFGWRRSGVDIQAAFDADLSALLRDGSLLRTPDNAIIPGAR